MKRVFFIYNGRFYSKKFLTETEINDIMNVKQELPILNQFGQPITPMDIDFTIDPKKVVKKRTKR